VFDQHTQLCRTWVAETLMLELRQELGLGDQMRDTRARGARRRSSYDIQVVVLLECNEGHIVFMPM
jgi:hypothetical protein